jgi:hypothetical protein
MANTTRTKRKQEQNRSKSYIKRSQAVVRPLRDNLIWNGKQITTGSRERVVLFGESENPLVKESARIITQGGREVEYKNLAHQSI